MLNLLVAVVIGIGTLTACGGKTSSHPASPEAQQNISTEKREKQTTAGRGGTASEKSKPSGTGAPEAKKIQPVGEKPSVSQAPADKPAPWQTGESKGQFPSGGAQPLQCLYKGMVYKVGESFKDDCNACTCTVFPDGNTGALCTAVLCTATLNINGL